MRKTLSRLGAALAIGAATAGCSTDPREGWSASSAFPDEIETIAVPIAQNDTFYRGIEFELTDVLIAEIESRTPYKVTKQSRADSILVTHVRKVDLDQLSKSTLTGLGEEVLIGLTIDFEWRDMSTDRSLVTRKSFTGQKLFVPSAPTRERLELGRMAVVRAVARDVVDEMRASW